ncbi:uncharacterized protein BXZ73DRAFT_10563, partial [Epithele typhae]|uniref:uncharacterized protein n=1 Tax=Epithele typhae TaxID=378194 RepID=UPI002007555B
HQFPYTPTVDSFSFYIVYMSYHIEPRSITSYLSGICSQLETYFPNVRQIRREPLVTRTLHGCMRMRSKPIHRKPALEWTDLQQAITMHPPSSYDDRLFMALLFTGFHCLLRLGDMVAPDKLELRSLRKITRRNSLSMSDGPSTISFTLPTHKSDRAFEGDHIVLRNLIARGPDPVAIVLTYLQARDILFPFQIELWLRANGSVPTRSWFCHRLHSIFPRDGVSGHSMRAGGATALAIAGVPGPIIQ